MHDRAHVVLNGGPRSGARLNITREELRDRFEISRKISMDQNPILAHHLGQNLGATPHDVYVLVPEPFEEGKWLAFHEDLGGETEGS